MPLASIIVPVYNEASFIMQTLFQLSGIGIKKEIIVVDNGSTDRSPQIVEDYMRAYPSERVSLYHAPIKGKANAMKKGIEEAKGDYIIFHDADLEYNPSCIPVMAHLLSEYDAVQGCRVCRPYHLGVGPFLANKIIIELINKMFNKQIYDVFTGQRGYRREFFDNWDIRSTGYEIETELTIRTLIGGYKFTEIDVR